MEFGTEEKEEKQPSPSCSLSAPPATLIHVIDKFMEGLTGRSYAADHHHKVPLRVTGVDTTTGEPFRPLDGLFVMMTELSLVASFLWSTSVAHEGTKECVKTVVARHLRDNVPAPLAYFGDRCCGDAALVKEYFPDIYVCGDAFHILHRYAQACDKRESRFGQFISALSDAIEIKEGETGDVVARRVDQVVMRQFQGSSVVTEQVRQTHRVQLKHIQLCLHLPPNFPRHVFDRFKRPLETRGTNRVETLWRNLRRVMKETMSLPMCESLCKIFFCSWNIDRLVQFSPR